MIENINKIKSLFFESFNTINKSLVQANKRNKLSESHQK